MTSSPPKLVSPQRRKIDGHANMGRYEHRNQYHILGMDGDESACSLEEPLFDEDQEISDVEVDDEDQRQTDIEEAEPQGAAAAAAGNAGEGVEDLPAPHQQTRIRLIARPVPMTRAQRAKHEDEGHANYNPRCEFCVRARGLPDRRQRCKSSTAEELNKAVEEEEFPTVSFELKRTGEGGPSSRGQGPHEEMHYGRHVPWEEHIECHIQRGHPEALGWISRFLGLPPRSSQV